jgi:glycosyltransferase involved in cell wall biosynthesis
MALAYTAKAARRHRFGRPSFRRQEINDTFTFISSVFLSTLVRHYDLVYCAYFADGCGVRLHQGISKRPYILFFAGIPYAHLLPPLWVRLLQFGLASAAATVTPSRIAGHYMQTDFGVKAEVIPPGIRLEHFPLGPRGDTKSPVILCISSPEEPRKNVPMLVHAFEALKREIPGAELQLCVSGSVEAAQHLHFLVGPAAREAIHIVRATDTTQIADLCAHASLVVQPASEESFGLALVEALACGTPVVAARSGALPELVDNPRIGTLFDLEYDTEGRLVDNGERLCAAMLEALELNNDPATPARCRQHASRYDWSVVGPKLEALYSRVVGEWRGKQATEYRQSVG